MKVYAIVAHDQKHSLTQHIFNNITTVMAEQPGIFVEPLDLYDHAEHIPFYTHNKATLQANPFFKQNKENFMTADRLLLVFPTYWYSTPGILKCWIDLITSYAWHYNGNRYAQPLHRIKKILIIPLTMTSWWQNTFIFGNPVNQQLKHTFKFMGIPSITFYTIDRAQAMTPLLFERHLAKIRKISKNFLS